MGFQHVLDEFLDEYNAAAGIVDEEKGLQFRAIGVTDYPGIGCGIKIVGCLAGHSNIKITESYDQRAMT